MDPLRKPKGPALPQPAVRPAVRPGAPANVTQGVAAALSAAQRAAPPRPAGPPSSTAFQPFQAGSSTFGSLAVNTAAAHPDIASDVSSLSSDLESLLSRATFNDLAREMNDLDSATRELADLAESARSEGYKFDASLNTRAFNAKSQWEAVRGQMFTSLQQQVSMMQSRLPTLAPVINQVNSVVANPQMARPLVSSARSQVSNMLGTVDQAERNLRGGYSSIQAEVAKLKTSYTNIHWAMDQLNGACFKLDAGEDLYAAVTARWDKEGKEDPEGIFYLTNRRLIFERKEKVATKKVLFITTASQLVQEVAFAQPLNALRSVKPDNRGLFGKDDYVILDFSDPKLGAVAIHLRGQESKDWADMIERGRTGRLDQERVAQGSISMADMSRPITAADIMTLQNDVASLLPQMMLIDVKKEMAEVENRVVSLSRNLADLRARGYVIEKYLEQDVNLLTGQWEIHRVLANRSIEAQVNALNESMGQLQNMTSTLIPMANNPEQARPLYLKAKSSLASAGAQAEAAQETARAQFRQYGQEVDAVTAHFAWIDWMLDSLSTASFRLNATESGVAAVSAIWDRPGTDPEDGVLFLTDQRLIWEKRGAANEVKINAPLKFITETKPDTSSATTAAVAGAAAAGKERLTFNFGPGAPMPAASFALAQPVAANWQKMVGRACSGDYAADRSVEVDPKEIERIKNAPQQCTRCGAAFTAPVLRGQTEITCEYCGNVVRF